MSLTWIEQRPHAAGPVDQKPLHILVGQNPSTGESTYVAFIMEELDGFRAIVPKVEHGSMRSQKMATPNYHYTHDTLQEAKDWCVAEIVNRRLT